MKRFNKSLRVLLVLSILTMSFQAASCTKSEALAQVQSIITELNTILPYAEQLSSSVSAGLVTQIKQGLADASSLATVIQNTTGNAAQYISALITEADGILASLPPGIIPVWVAPALGVINLAISWLATNYLNVTPATASVVRKLGATSPTDAQLQTIRAFLARPGNPSTTGHLKLQYSK